MNYSNQHQTPTRTKQYQATSVSTLDHSGSKSDELSPAQRKRKKKTSKDIHQEVTSSIIEKLEQGVKPWSCPWRSTNNNLPINGVGVCQDSCHL